LHELSKTFGGKRMSERVPTIQIKSDHLESQGAFVVINEKDFDPAKGHELYVEEAETVIKKNLTTEHSTVAQLKQYLTEHAIPFPPYAAKPELVALYEENK
jgi:hypothetical protein